MDRRILPGFVSEVHVVLFWCRWRLPEEGPEEGDAHGGAHQGAVGIWGRPGGGRLPWWAHITVVHNSSLVFFFIQNSTLKSQWYEFEYFDLNHVLYETLNPVGQLVLMATMNAC